jgi:hypothetical protein
MSGHVNCCWSRQHSNAWFRVPRDLWSYFSVSRLCSSPAIDDSIAACLASTAILGTIFYCLTNLTTLSPLLTVDSSPVVGLTTAQFNPLKPPVHGFILSNSTYSWFQMILNDFGLSMQALHLSHRSFSTSIHALSRRPGHYGPYGLCGSFVTALYKVPFIQGIQRFPVNAGLCSRLCLNLCHYSETAVSQLNGWRPDHHQI